MTKPGAERNPELVDAAHVAGVTVSGITERAAAALSETVTPQGVIAVCDLVDTDLDTALAHQPLLVAVLYGVADPGNAGTVIRVADAAGADAVLLAGDTVDPHNGKCVRASAGSLFHLPIARTRRSGDVLSACRAAGLRLVAADGHAADDLDDARQRPGRGRPPGCSAVRRTVCPPTCWPRSTTCSGCPSTARRRA